MKIVFEIVGEINEATDLTGNLNELSDTLNQIRGFASAKGQYKIVYDKEEWQKID